MRSIFNGFQKVFILCALIIVSAPILRAEDGILLYTPYTSVSVPPGETVDYSIDVKNTGDTVRNVDIYVSGLGRDWTSTLKAGGYNIKRVSVLPGEKRTISMTVNVPSRVNKGNHWFKVVARNFDVLPLLINVSEQGTLKTEFTTDHVNMEGHADADFTFNTKLKNSTGQKQVYSFHAEAPRGWKVIFKPNYKQATAVEVEPNGTKNVSVKIDPPYNVKAGSYKIPIRAVNRSTSAELELEVVISASYEMDLTTPDGRLSAGITAGDEKVIELLLKNTGSGVLEEVVFDANKPKNWSISFEPDTIKRLEAGKSIKAKALIKSADKAIPGDYVTKITAKTPETKSLASLRISVKTPLLWGWMGILIIAGTLGVIFYLFKKYGRR